MNWLIPFLLSKTNILDSAPILVYRFYEERKSMNRRETIISLF
ncbi:hypothetical protein FM130_05135 [Enterococcus faecium]|nr:hypothetical protein FM130_05135 [Enterococcus faecium]